MSEANSLRGKNIYKEKKNNKILVANHLCIPTAILGEGRAPVPAGRPRRAALRAGEGLARLATES